MDLLVLNLWASRYAKPLCRPISLRLLEEPPPTIPVFCCYQEECLACPLNKTRNPSNHCYGGKHGIQWHDRDFIKQIGGQVSKDEVWLVLSGRAVNPVNVDDEESWCPFTMPWHHTFLSSSVLVDIISSIQRNDHQPTPCHVPNYSAQTTTLDKRSYYPSPLKSDNILKRRDVLLWKDVHGKSSSTIIVIPLAVLQG